MKRVVLLAVIFSFAFAIPVFSSSCLKEERGVYACWKCGKPLLECKCTGGK